MQEKRPFAMTRRTKLYQVLFEGLPCHRSQVAEGALNVRQIGEDLSISDKAIYGWFNRQSVPAKKVKALMSLKGSKLTWDDLAPFVID